VILINTTLAALLFALPHYHWLDLPMFLTPTLFTAACELAISALLFTLLIKHLRVPAIFYLCTLTSVAMLLTFTLGGKYMSPNSAKPLVTRLQTMLQPTDTVVNYFKFYQDVPLYLGRTIILVADWKSPEIETRDNWVRELWYSMSFQNTDEILLNEAPFWKRWNSSEKIYVLVNQNYFNQFLSHTKQYYFIEKYNDIILLCNQKP
jgi:hypothetical protein